jgi:alpha-tubulin suppressor-like RCC1 family protein/plastocyanin
VLVAPGSGDSYYVHGNTSDSFATMTEDAEIGDTEIQIDDSSYFLVGDTLSLSSDSSITNPETTVNVGGSSHYVLYTFAEGHIYTKFIAEYSSAPFLRLPEIRIDGTDTWGTGEIVVGSIVNARGGLTNPRGGSYSPGPSERFEVISSTLNGWLIQRIREDGTYYTSNQFDTGLEGHVWIVLEGTELRARGTMHVNITQAIDWWGDPNISYWVSPSSTYYGNTLYAAFGTTEASFVPIEQKEDAVISGFGSIQFSSALTKRHPAGRKIRLKSPAGSGQEVDHNKKGYISPLYVTPNGLTPGSYRKVKINGQTYYTTGSTIVSDVKPDMPNMPLSDDDLDGIINALDNKDDSFWAYGNGPQGLGYYYPLYNSPPARDKEGRPVDSIPVVIDGATYYMIDTDTRLTSVDGYYPLYFDKTVAEGVGDGGYTEHVFNGKLYYMPTGVNRYLGNYDGTQEGQGISFGTTIAPQASTPDVLTIGNLTITSKTNGANSGISVTIEGGAESDQVIFDPETGIITVRLSNDLSTYTEKQIADLINASSASSHVDATYTGDGSSIISGAITQAYLGGGTDGGAGVGALSSTGEVTETITNDAYQVYGYGNEGLGYYYPVYLNAFGLSNPISKTIDGITYYMEGETTTDLSVGGDGANYYFTGGENDGSVGNPTLTLAVGDTFVFDNLVHSSHPIQIKDSGGNVVGSVDAEGNYTFNPTTPGEYTYVCSNHASMNGKITVTAVALGPSTGNGEGTSPSEDFPTSPIDDPANPVETYYAWGSLGEETGYIYPLSLVPYQDWVLVTIGGKSYYAPSNTVVSESIPSGTKLSPIADTDSDGIPDIYDADDDGDGVSDLEDIYPIDPNRASGADSDGDGVDDEFDAYPEDPSQSLITYTLSLSGGGILFGAGDYAEGSTVTIGITEPVVGQEFSSWTFSTPVAFEDGVDATMSLVQFRMPARAVTATANYELVTYTVTVDGDGTEAGGGTYAPGSTVTLGATALSGYEFSSWSFDTGVTFVDGTNANTNDVQFTMPSSDVTATANYVAVYDLPTHANINYTQPTDGNVEAGEVVKFTVTDIPSGQEIDTVTVTVNSVAVTVDPDPTAPNFKFTMPSGATSAPVLNVEFKANIYSMTSDITGGVLQGTKSISAGNNYTVYLRENGSAWAVGHNYYGQLGNGTTTNTNNPTQVKNLDATDFTDIIQVEAGYNHAVYLKSNGTVWAVGRNNSGQLGDGSKTQRNNPVQVKHADGAEFNKVVAVSAGEFHTVYLKSDGTVWAVGYGNYGGLGDGTTDSYDSPIQVKNQNGNDFTDVIEIAAGSNYTVYLKSDGTVWATGTNTYGQLGDGTQNARYNPVQVKHADGTVLSEIVGISAGSYHTLYLKNDGTVWAAGRNNFGQLGDGTTTDRNYPTQVKNINTTDFTDVIAVEAGNYHTLYSKSDTTVWAAGLNIKGQLGDGTTTDRNNPVQVTNVDNSIFNGVVGISAGGSHAAYLKSDSNAWASGSNDFDQLGNGTSGGSTNKNPIQSNISDLQLSGIILSNEGKILSFAILPQPDHSLVSISASGDTSSNPVAVTEDPVGNNVFNLTMPSENVTLLASYTQNTYTVTVSGDGEETGGNDYTPGSTVTLGATAPSGYEFSSWSFSPSVTFVDSTNANTNAVKFTMPSSDVTATANYTLITYAVTVSGDGEEIGGDSYAPGSTVTLGATAPSGYEFSSWSFSPSVTFVDSTNANTNAVKFTMPSSDVTVTANYVANGAPAMNYFVIPSSFTTSESFPGITLSDWEFTTTNLPDTRWGSEIQYRDVVTTIRVYVANANGEDGAWYTGSRTSTSMAYLSKYDDPAFGFIFTGGFSLGREGYEMVAESTQAYVGILGNDSQEHYGFLQDFKIYPIPNVADADQYTGQPGGLYIEGGGYYDNIPHKHHVFEYKWRFSEAPNSPILSYRSIIASESAQDIGVSYTGFDTEPEDGYVDGTAPKLPITVNSSFDYSITSDLSETGTYTSGSQITLTATPPTDYEFVQWTNVPGIGTSTSNPVTFTMPTAPGSVNISASYRNTTLFTVESE